MQQFMFKLKALKNELDRDDIASLEARKDKITRLDEESWRPKIHVIYLSKGDNIMTLFINMLKK